MVEVVAGVAVSSRSAPSPRHDSLVGRHGERDDLVEARPSRSRRPTSAARGLGRIAVPPGRPGRTATPTSTAGCKWASNDGLDSPVKPRNDASAARSTAHKPLLQPRPPSAPRYPLEHLVALPRRRAGAGKWRHLPPGVGVHRGEGLGCRRTASRGGGAWASRASGMGHLLFIVAETRRAGAFRILRRVTDVVGTHERLSRGGGAKVLPGRTGCRSTRRSSPRRRALEGGRGPRAATKSSPDGSPRPTRLYSSRGQTRPERRGMGPALPPTGGARDRLARAR